MEDVQTSSADYMLDMAENLVTQCKKMVSNADELLHPKEKWEAAKNFSRQHPIVACFVIILVAMSVIPIVCFCAFAICLTLVVLASCLFFEGDYPCCAFLIYISLTATFITPSVPRHRCLGNRSGIHNSMAIGLVTVAYGLYSEPAKVFVMYACMTCMDLSQWLR